MPAAPAEQPDRPSLRTRALVAGLWLAGQSAYNTVANAVALVVLARLVAPSAFGLVAITSVVISLVTIVTDFGVTPMLERVEQVSDEQLSTGFWLSLGIGVVLTAAIEAIAPAFASLMREPQLTLILRVVALSVPITAVWAVPTALLRRDLQAKVLARRQVVAVTVATLGAIVLAVLHAGAWALVFQDVGSVTLEAIVLWRNVGWRPRLCFDRVQARGLLAFGSQVTLTQLIDQGRDRIVELLIGRILGVRLLGVWVIASRVSSVCLAMFTTVAMQVALPAFARFQSDRERLGDVFRQAQRTLGAVAMPGMLAIAAAAPVAIPALFGARWHQSGGLGRLLCIYAGAAAVTWLDSAVWWSLGRPSIALAISGMGAVATLVCVGIVCHLGLSAVAWSVVAIALLQVPLRIGVLSRLGGISPRAYGDLPAAVVCAVSMGIATAVVGRLLAGSRPILILLAEAATAALFYLALSWLLQRPVLDELRRDLRRISA
ncbi:MAG: lipopolysaccharide biosynthesis protein [Solirubrobacteraceae bacterium]